MTATLTGPGGSVQVSNEVEIKNDQGNPVPVTAQGAATETTLQQLLAELGAKLEPADLAALATAAKQDATKAVLDAILAAVDGLEGNTTGLATEAKLEAVRALLAGTLSAAITNFPATQQVQDEFTTGEALPDQTPALSGVLAFNFTAPVNLVFIRVRGGVGRADPFGGTPTATTGIYCADDEPTPIPVTTSQVKVHAPSNVPVSVWGFAY
jgi:hypothetical protein